MFGRQVVEAPAAANVARSAKATKRQQEEREKLLQGGGHVVTILYWNVVV